MEDEIGVVRMVKRSYDLDELLKILDIEDVRKYMVGFSVTWLPEEDEGDEGPWYAEIILPEPDE